MAIIVFLIFGIPGLLLFTAISGNSRARRQERQIAQLIKATNPAALRPSAMDEFRYRGPFVGEGGRTAALWLAGLFIAGVVITALVMG